MPRPASSPPFPDSPGGWLTCYRWRSRASDGRPYSPESLGATLGVSGPTVRRWERGKVRPSQQDLANLTEVCSLNRFEAEFLFRAFQEDEPSETDPRSLAALGRSLLDIDYPAFLVDRFYYVRGHNSYVTVLPDTLGLTERFSNLLAQVLEDPEDDAEIEATKAHLFLDFWLSSARACGTNQYRRVLAGLRQIPEFERRWWDLALGRWDTSGWTQPFNAPFSFAHNKLGSFRAYPYTVTLPPTFQVLELHPLDEITSHRLDAAVSAGPPAVFLEGRAAPLGREQRVA